MSISHAYVMYTNGVEKIVSTNCLENHFPQTKDDFVLNQRYRIWLNGNKGESDFLLKGFILLLGESEKDILIQKNEKRLRYSNKRNISFSSSFSSTNDGRTAGRTQETKVKKIVKTKLDLKKVDAKQHNNNKILTKHFINLMKQRKPITDGSSDSDEMEMSDETNIEHKMNHLNSNDTHVLSNGEDLNSDESSEPSASCSEEDSRERSVKRHSDVEADFQSGEQTPPASIIKVAKKPSLMSREFFSSGNPKSPEGTISCSDESRQCLSSALKNTGDRRLVLSSRRSNTDDDNDKELENSHSTDLHRKPSACSDGDVTSQKY